MTTVGWKQDFDGYVGHHWSNASGLHRVVHLTFAISTIVIGILGILGAITSFDMAIIALTTSGLLILSHLATKSYWHSLHTVKCFASLDSISALVVGILLLTGTVNPFVAGWTLLACHLLFATTYSAATTFAIST